MSKMLPQLLQLKIMICLLFLIYNQHSETARILIISPIPSKSHYNMHARIANGLLSRGHEITHFNPFDDGSTKSHENLTYIMTIDKSKVSFVDSISVHNSGHRGMTSHIMHPIIRKSEQNMCNITLSNIKMKEIIKMKKIPFDLIIFESYSLYCFLPLAEKHQLPAINLLPVGYSVSNSRIGKPNLPSFIPFLLSEYSYDMNFFQRLYNTIGYVLYMANHFLISNPVCNRLIREHYGPNIKSVDEMFSQIKLALHGTHPTIISSPHPPNVVEIGGVHIVNEKPLPVDIQNFIDESKEGVIYFSFGTAIRFSSIPPETLDIFLGAFAEIPQRILLRCDLPNNTNFPSNVMAKNWVPQRDVLAHKNVRAFISHMGMNSFMEAIHTGTPMVAIPFIFDQPSNARIAEKIGVAVYLDFDSLTKEDLVEAVNSVIHDKKYFNKMQEMSYAFRDRPMSPLDTAIYWIEYVIRHNGASHLRPISADQPLYKYLLLDVFLFIILAFGLLSYILFFIIAKILTKLSKLSFNINNYSHQIKKNK